MAHSDTDTLSPYFRIDLYSQTTTVKRELLKSITSIFINVAIGRVSNYLLGILCRKK